MVVVGLDNDERFTEIMQIVQGTQRTCTKKEKRVAEHKCSTSLLHLCSAYALLLWFALLGALLTADGGKVTWTRQKAGTMAAR